MNYLQRSHTERICHPLKIISVYKIDDGTFWQFWAYFTKWQCYGCSFKIIISFPFSMISSITRYSPLRSWQSLYVQWRTDGTRHRPVSTWSLVYWASLYWGWVSALVTIVAILWTQLEIWHLDYLWVMLSIF